MSYTAQSRAVSHVSAKPRRGIIKTLLFWMARAQSRKHLQKITDDQLEDCGLTRHEIEVECAKPFWQD